MLPPGVQPRPDERRQLPQGAQPLGPDPVKIFFASMYSMLELKHSNWLKIVTQLTAAIKNPGMPD